jgi:4-amino-4-deoxy-L-arabinose transferase-like glycosyltransferase
MAAFLRFYRLGSLPPGLYHDEAYNGLDALSLLAGESFPRFYEGWELYAQDAHAGRPPEPTRWPVFFEGNYGREPLHVYLMALSIRYFGATPFAIRVVPALAGVLAILTTYLAARSLFPQDRDRFMRGELLPLVAAFSLAVLYPALHFSRFGIRAMVMLPVLTMAVFAFWRGWRASGRWSLVWLAGSGIFVGLGFYTFAAARLFPLTFIAFGLFMLWADRQALVSRWRGLALALTTSLLTAAPLLLFFARYPYFFVFRMAYVANRGKGVVEGSPLVTWWLNIGRVVRGLFWLGETHLRHNLPGRSYMDPIQAILFLTGLVKLARRWARPENVFLIIWFGVMLLPSILSGDAPHFGRLTGVGPPVSILIAVGVTWITEAMARRASQKFWVGATLAVLTLPSLILTTRDYFSRYASHPDLARDFYLDDWQMGRYAAEQPAETVLYLTPSQEEMATIYYALADPDRLRSFNGQDGLIPAGVLGFPSLYLVRPQAEETLANLRDYFAGSTVETDPTSSAFTSLQVPAEIERIVNPAEEPVDFGGVIGLPGWGVAVDREVVDVTLTWQAFKAMETDYTAFVHLIDETGTIISQTDRQPAGFPTSDWRPGEIVVDTFRVEIPADLIAGDYRLRTGFYYLPTMEQLGTTVLSQPVQIDGLNP